MWGQGRWHTDGSHVSWNVGESQKGMFLTAGEGRDECEGGEGIPNTAKVTEKAGIPGRVKGNGLESLSRGALAALPLVKVHSHPFPSYLLLSRRDGNPRPCLARCV